MASNQLQPHVCRGGDTEILAISVPLPCGAPKVGTHIPAESLPEGPRAQPSVSQNPTPVCGNVRGPRPGAREHQRGEGWEGISGIRDLWDGAASPCVCGCANVQTGSRSTQAQKFGKRPLVRTGWKEGRGVTPRGAGRPARGREPAGRGAGRGQPTSAIKDPAKQARVISAATP